MRWRPRWETGRQDTGYTKIRAPKGFHFKVESSYNDYIYIYLYNSQNVIVGKLTLQRSYYKRDQYQTHSWLNEKYHGKGLGVLLYSKGIQWCLEHGYKIRSSGYSSDKAQRVWRGETIRKNFNIRMRNYSRSKDPIYDTWYAYPLERSKPNRKPKTMRHR